MELFCYFYKGDNFTDLLFALLHTKTLVKMKSTLKGNNVLTWWWWWGGRGGGVGGGGGGGGGKEGNVTPSEGFKTILT